MDKVVVAMLSPLAAAETGKDSLAVHCGAHGGGCKSQFLGTGQLMKYE